MDDTKKDIKVGKMIGIATENSRVFGLLGACCTFLNQEGKEEKIYTIYVGERVVDIYEHEITDIIVLSEIPDKRSFLEEIEEKHGIECFDKDGEMLSNSIIMAKIMDKNIWDELTEEEKIEFTGNISFSKEDMVEMINVLFDLKYENQKMHDKRVTALDNAIELMDKFKLIKECAPWIAVCCDLVYKELGIEKLINSI